MKKIILFFAVFAVICTSCTAKLDSKQQEDAPAIVAYDNPIDEYFIPRIKSASSEVERRELQDTYKGVWESEFKSVASWMMAKYQYQEDKDRLTKYVDGVILLIDDTADVIITDWLDDYKLPPDSRDRKSWGNGTRSGLNQVSAEIYRDASMRLIEHCEGYIFREVDYSKEHYE